MTRIAVAAASILASCAWSPGPAQAQLGNDLSICQHLAVQAGSYLRQLERSGATSESLKQAIHDTPAARRAGRMWSDATLFSLIDFVAREQRQGPDAVLARVIRRCAEVIPNGIRRSARSLERYCLAIHEKAYLIARDRRAGVTRESALDWAHLVTRPNLLRDVIALVEEAYEGPPRAADDFALTLLQRCILEDDVIMPGTDASARSEVAARQTSPAVPVPVAAAFDDGLADRARIETWLAGLDGDFRDGAVFWSGQRSLRQPQPCDAAPRSTQWREGCVTSRERFAPTDVRRRSEPDYRRGWNSWAPPVALGSG